MRTPGFNTARPFTLWLWRDISLLPRVSSWLSGIGLSKTSSFLKRRLSITSRNTNQIFCNVLIFSLKFKHYCYGPNQKTCLTLSKNEWVIQWFPCSYYWINNLSHWNLALSVYFGTKRKKNVTLNWQTSTISTSKRKMDFNKQQHNQAKQQ